MRKVFTINFWMQLFISTFMTMVMIYLIKTITARVNIPVVSNIAQAA